MSEDRRSISAIYLAFALQSLGQAMAWQFGTYFLKDVLGVNNYVLLTTVWSVPALMTMVAVGYWGAFSDKHGKRRPFMLLGFMGYSFTFLLVSFVSSFVEWFIISTVGAVFSAAAIPSGQALATTATARKGERIGLFLVAQSAGWFIGALSSGFLYDILGMFNLYRIAAVTSVCATIVCAAYVKDYEIDLSSLREKSSVAILLHRPGMVRLALAAGLSALGINAISTLTAIVIVDELGGPSFYVGIANSGATLVAVLITGYIGRVVDRRGPGGILVAAYASYALFAVGFALARDPITASILYALPIYPLANTAAFAFAALLSSDSERGGAMGIINGAQNAGTALGPMIGGVFAEFIFYSVQPISWISMIFNIVACGIAITLLPLAWKVGRSSESTSIEDTKKNELLDNNDSNDRFTSGA
jgi:MFS family permease